MSEVNGVSKLLGILFALNPDVANVDKFLMDKVSKNPHILVY